jgi:methionine--tRNA ligase beta chain
LSVNSLDLRVGLITSCVKHETADKLYCEEIDIGEEEKRPIASGLVKHYSLDEMQNRKVIVIANLAPRKLVGFKSHGMVLCAAKVIDGEEKVEFVEVPKDAPIGSRIVGLGLPISTALSPKQVDKQKAWEALSTGLRSDENGIAYWNDSKLVVEGTDNHCYAPTLSGAILR